MIAYVDDVILAYEEREILQILRRFEKEAATIGLKINYEKN